MINRDFHYFSVNGRLFSFSPAENSFYRFPQQISDLYQRVIGSSRQSEFEDRLSHDPITDPLRASGGLATVEIENGHHSARRRILTFNIFPSMICNLECQYCYNHSLFSADEPKARRMNFQVAEAVVDEIKSTIENSADQADIEAVVVRFTGGGEPLSNFPVIRFIVEQLRSAISPCRLEVRLVTNGTMLVPKVAAAINELGMKVRISIDGPEHINDVTRMFPGGRSSYALAERGIQNALRELPPYSVGIGLTIGRFNWNVIDAMTPFIQMGVRYLRFFPVIQRGEKRLTDEDWTDCQRELDRFFDWYIDKLVTTERPEIYVETVAALALRVMNPQLRNPICNGGSDAITIGVEGETYACCATPYLFDPKKKAGANCGDGVLLPCTMLGTPSECRSCWAWNLCGGGCRFANHEGGGDYSTIDPFRCHFITHGLERATHLVAILKEKNPEALERLLTVTPI